MLHMRTKQHVYVHFNFIIAQKWISRAAEILEFHYPPFIIITRILYMYKIYALHINYASNYIHMV